MTPARVRAIYKRLLRLYGETVYFRRYAGTGQVRTSTDYPVKARIREYRPDELIGGIVQGQRDVIALAEDVENSGFPLPFVATVDYVVIRGAQIIIASVDDNTCRIGDTLIAYEIRAGG